MPGMRKMGLEGHAPIAIFYSEGLAAVLKRDFQTRKGELKNVPVSFSKRAVLITEMYAFAPGLDPARIDVNLKRGMLMVRMPKAAHVQPRRIEKTQVDGRPHRHERERKTKKNGGNSAVFS